MLNQTEKKNLVICVRLLMIAFAVSGCGSGNCGAGTSKTAGPSSYGGFHGTATEWEAAQNIFAFPNISDGPNPIFRNFFETKVYYPGYLLCGFPIKEKKIDAEKTRLFFAQALLQIRTHGSQEFPPTNRIAVIIVNYWDYKGVPSWVSSHQAGATFDAGDVFDLSVPIERLAADAAISLEPFAYNSLFPIGDRDRWLIVEREIKERK